MSAAENTGRIPDAVLAEIRARLTPGSVIGRRVRLTGPRGKQVGLCPFHTETTGSFHVYENGFHCFGCGANGDVIDFVQRTDGLLFPAAVEWCSAEAGITPAAPGARRPSADVVPLPARGAAAAKPDDMQPIMPVPADAPAPPAQHPVHGLPEHIAEIRDAAGDLLMLICRFPPTDGGRKQIVPLTYGVMKGKTDWHWKAPPAPRPLYGLDRLAAHPGLPVVVVEGEMKCDAAQRLLAGRAVAVSWPNGASGVGKAGWDVLRGCDVAVWPDADAPGATAAASVVNVLRGIAASARIVALPDGLAKGWDLADAEREGWTGEQVWAWVAAGAPKPPAAPTPRDEYDGPDGPDDRGPPQAPRSRSNGDPFVVLGHNRGRYYIYTRRGRQVLEMTPQQLKSDAYLFQLAPLRWWESEFPGRESFSAKQVSNHIIGAALDRDVFDPDTVRGRGAWLDDGRAVLHLGNRILVDGETRTLDDIDSTCVYEQGRRIPLDTGLEPLTTKESARLLDLCMEPPWERREAHGRLLAGWLVIAPICGAMQWRPHIWITSEAGGGKSWVLKNLVRPFLGPLALAVASKTSEPALRRLLQSDARPVIFEEAETQNSQDLARVQQILDLARASSDEDGAQIAKAETGGNGVQVFRIRSCFAFASINLALSQAADESRTVVLPLEPKADKAERSEAFQKLEAMHREIVVPGYADRLLLRTMRLLPIIRANTETFGSALASAGYSRRAGDTLGALLAGAWSLRSSRAATREEADAFIAANKWVQDSASRGEAEPEWKRAASFLCQQTLRVARSNGKTEDITVAELLEAMAGRTEEIRPSDAATNLARAGIREMFGEGVLIANTSHVIRKWFSETPWAAGWLATLARAPGAKRTDKAWKFAGHVSKALSVPLDVLLGGEADEG